MLRVSWTLKKTNVSKLNQLGIKNRLRILVTERITSNLGVHICRNVFQKSTIQGKLEGSRGRGKTPIRYTDLFGKEVGATLGKCIRIVANRKNENQKQIKNYDMILGAYKRLKKEEVEGIFITGLKFRATKC